MSLPYCIAALYKFAPVSDPSTLRASLRERLNDPSLCGSLLIASEGLNGTLAGSEAAIDAAIKTLRAIPGFGDLDVKISRARRRPFRKLKIRLKAEIVTMGMPDADPNKVVGTYVVPADWNTLISDPDTVVIDTRNDYEVKIGTFAGAINPETLTFGAFPYWFKDSFGDRPPKRVAMFCTGGIRCEKATSFVKQMGIDEVYHLKGGILKYLETVPEDDSLWRGDCFVFDERVAVGHGLVPANIGLCRACKYPVTARDMAHPAYERGVSCARCIDHTTAEQKDRFRERQRQMTLAKQRGTPHLTGYEPID